ncbi:fetuin-B-like [Pleurodeles waltl]|uniref:fetuin-B-like n=1 Tax=Pleurodeles waltl TaxID=8319 RepID=UPI0037098F2C
MMIAKYNKESNNTHYYKVYMVENSNTQWEMGPSYFVEIVIKETNCSKSETNVTDCHFLQDEQAHVGFCKGSQISKLGEDGVTVSCEIYEPTKLSLPRYRDHEHYGEDHGKVDIFHKHQYDSGGKIARLPKGTKIPHEEKHEEAHGNGSPSGEPQNHPTQKPGRKPIPPYPRGPVGSVEYYHMINETDVFPSPSNPVPSHHKVLPGSSQTHKLVEPEHPIDSGFIGPFQDPEPQPFPLHPSESTGCPSNPKHTMPHIASLLPKP